MLNAGESVAMKLLTVAQEAQLIANFNLNNSPIASKQPNGYFDHKPVVKLFGGAACTWLLTELNPENRMFFGLCDIGMGFPELGYVMEEELLSIRFKPFGLKVERDLHFKPTKTINEYLAEAKRIGRIQA